MTSAAPITDVRTAYSSGGLVAQPAGAAPLGTDRSLRAVNRVVSDSLRSWTLPERVRRLALPSLLYREGDLEHMTVVLVHEAGYGVAVATWEPAGGRDAPHGSRSALLHGLFVVPGHQRRGLGTSLLELVEHRADARGFDGITVRAWRESESFFVGRGFGPLAGADGTGVSPRRLWKALS